MNESKSGVRRRGICTLQCGIAAFAITVGSCLQVLALENSGRQPPDVVVLRDSALGRTAIHDLGTVNAINLFERYSESLTKQRKMSSQISLRMTELSHEFVLRNSGQYDVTVDDVVSDCQCTEPSFADPLFRGLPYSLAAGSETRISVSFNPSLVQAGAVRHYVALNTGELDNTIATFILTGKIDNGIKIVRVDGEALPSNGMKNRPVPVGYRRIALLLDRRLPKYFPPGTVFRLEWEERHRNIRAILRGDTKSNAKSHASGILINSSTFRFTSNKALADDARVLFDIPQAHTSSGKPIAQEIRLDTSLVPYYNIHRRMTFEIW